MATPSTLSQNSGEDTALSIPKSQRRPPALVLEEYNQEYSHVTVQAGAPEGLKVKQEYGMLRRLHNLLPMSYTPNTTAAPTAYYTASSDTPQLPHTADPKPELVPLRKVRSPRSASLPSIRWDKSPLSRRNTREGSSLAKVATSEGTSAPVPDPPLNVKGLKIRMITWNMHDSLPKGELEELLGKVLPYSPTTPGPAGAFPNLPVDPDHPYHFVVVAGQECPSVSGLPMAVGAGFKLREKEKEREDKENARGPSFEKDSDSRSSMQQGRSKDGTRSPDSRKSEPYLVKPTITTVTDGRTPSPESLQIVIPNPPIAGWTSVVEDWLCNGGIFELPKGPKTPKIVEVVGNVVTGAVPGTPRLALKRAPSIKEPKKGPYQFLVKERLMGIYLAIYVHRDLKPLIKGTSKSAVTAGLVGGRFGNKGGVGISVNLDGTTLLFLNCHLAAHEGKMHHRLANLAKIKSELEVDDFLPKDDPRKKLEDLTDRFDFTFLCGDLNFRLDITRLHADWLIARQDYAQALTFDQLLKAMKDGTQEFSGFREAPINFPPTFKYDVLRTLKRQKRGDNEDDDDPDAEAMSISSLSTSYSRNTDLDLTNNGFASPATPAVPSSSSKLSLSHIVSAHKAKVRLLSLKSPFSAMSSPSKTGRKRAGTAGTAETGYFAIPAGPASPANTAFPPTPKMIDHAIVVPPTPPLVDNTPLVPPPKVRVESMLSGVGSGSQDYFDVEKGVYDTSNKKRVPSWCDRILWKTTVERSTSPEPKPDHRQLLSPPPPKSTGGKLFARLRTRSAKASRPPPLPAPRRKSSEEPSTDFLPPLKTAPPLSQTIFTSTDEPGNGGSSAPLNGAAAQNASSAGVAQGGFFGRRGLLSGTIGSPPPTAPERPRRATGFGVLMSPLSGGNGNGEGAGTPSRWRFLPNFLSPLSPHSHAEAAVEEQVTPVVTPAIVHRRGDVVCLDYNTLDDRRMRRLEGRSDHRPVLGTFVVYI